MKSWRNDPMFDRIEREWSNPNICTNCGHNGLMRSHTKNGCEDCGTLEKCNSSYKYGYCPFLNSIIKKN